MASLFRRRSSKNITEDQDLEKALRNWNLPRVSVNEIYKRRGIFESSKHYKIETSEKTEIIQGEYQDLQVNIDKNSIARHKRNYVFLHMGLVQVAIKPLTRNGMNNSVLVSLCDSRCGKFEYSRFAVAEFSLKNGPVYFNCYPNYTLPLRTDNPADILDTMTLSLKIHGFNSENQNSRDIAVVYKVHYKVKGGIFVNGDPEPKNKLSRGSTTFVESNLASTNISVQKTTDWDSVEIPERWSLDLQ